MVLLTADFASRCNELFIRASDLGALSDDERTAYELNRFVCEFEQGGLSGFLYNISPTSEHAGWPELNQVVQALHTVGCTSSAEALASLREWLLRADHANATTWGEYCEAIGMENLSRSEAALSSQLSDVLERLEQLVMALPSSNGASDRDA